MNEATEEAVEKRDDLAFLTSELSSVVTTMTAAIEDQIPTFNGLCKQFGIEPFETPTASWTDYDWHAEHADADVVPTQFARENIRDAGTVYELAQEWAKCEQARRLPGQVVRTFEFGAGATPKRFESTQAAVGYPGTRIVDGRIEVEQNTKLRPGRARGQLGSPGEYEELYRVDPMTHRFCNATSTLICNATYDHHTPHEIDDGGELDAILARAHRLIMQACGHKWRIDCATFTRHGFAFSEPRWSVYDGGFIGLHSCEYRDQAITWRHLFDDRMSDHVGTEFKASGWTGFGGSPDFTLTRGLTPDTFRLLNVNINATGNLIEGVPSTRPVTGLDHIRRIILQLTAVSHQRFAVPIGKVKADLAGIAGAVMESIQVPEIGELSKVAARMQKVRGRIPGVIPLKPGIDFTWETPLGDAPDATIILNYIDMMKAVCLGNEGVLTGTQSFGSYGMATVAVNRYLRTAPVYADRMAAALTELLQAHVRWNYSRAAELEQLPFYQARFPHQVDAQKWLADARETWAAQPWLWPKPMREQAATLLGLPSDTFEDPEIARATLVDNGMPTDDLKEVAA